jgi:hypothetical protein
LFYLLYFVTHLINNYWWGLGSDGVGLTPQGKNTETFVGVEKNLGGSTPLPLRQFQHCIILKHISNIINEQLNTYFYLA